MKIKSLLAITLLSALVFCTKEAETDKDIRADYIGNWKCTQTSKYNGTSEFTVNIKEDVANDSRIEMYNFYAIGSANFIYADISTTAANSISITKQSFSSDFIEGSGNDVSSTKLTFNYTADDGNVVDTLSAVFNKIQ
ncbi:MAG: hypothetical protein ACO3EE_05785 [Flavobacteriales bacterium]